MNSLKVINGTVKRFVKLIKHYTKRDELRSTIILQKL